MRKKIFAGLLLLSMTASSFSNLGYVPVYATGYEDDTVVVTEEASSVEDAVASVEDVEQTEQDLMTAGNLVDSGKYDTWTWSLDKDGVLLIDGEIQKGDLFVWPWGEYREDIKEATVTGSGTGDINSLFAGCTSLTSLDLSNFDTTNATDMSYMLWCCYELNNLVLGNFNTSNVTSMDSMFGNCTSLTSLDVSSFDTGNVTNMGSMFWGCSGLKELDLSNFNTEKVTGMYAMFNKCSGLTSLNVSQFDTSNVSSMSSVFSGCSALTELNISNFDTGNATDISNLFFGCTSLKNIDVSKFDTSNVTDMGYMFYNCPGLTELDIHNFDAGKVTNMDYMLYGCNSLTKIESPYNITVKATLPNGITWVDDSGNIVTTMYQNRPESITYSDKNSLQESTFTYSIQFNGNGADSGEPYVLMDCKKDVVCPLPGNSFSRTGYTFTGWNTKADGSGDAYADNAEVMNLTTENGSLVPLYAQWTPIHYSVEFHKNKGSGSMSSMTEAEYDSTYTLPANTYIRTGYTFTGWNTKADGSGRTYKNQASINNLTSTNGQTITLYAQWKKVTVATAKKPTLSNVATKKLVVSYKTVTGAKGYKIQYATNSKMKNAKTIYVTGTKKTISNVTKGKTYYVRIAAYKYDSTGKKTYGKYSPIQSKKITK